MAKFFEFASYIYNFLVIISFVILVKRYKSKSVQLTPFDFYVGMCFLFEVGYFVILGRFLKYKCFVIGNAYDLIVPPMMIFVFYYRALNKQFVKIFITMILLTLITIFFPIYIGVNGVIMIYHISIIALLINVFNYQGRIKVRKNYWENIIVAIWFSLICMRYVYQTFDNYINNSPTLLIIHNIEAVYFCVFLVYYVFSHGIRKQIA